MASNMGDVIKIDNRLVKPVDLNFIMDNLKGVLRFYKSGVEKDLMIPVVQEREGNFLTLDGRHRFLARVLMEKQFGQAYLICGSGDTIEENLFPDKMHPMVREDIRHIVRARYNIVMPCYDSYI